MAIGMTWGEFKKWMEERGAKDADPIWYIDWAFQPTEFERDPVQGIRVA